MAVRHSVVHRKHLEHELACSLRNTEKFIGDEYITSIAHDSLS